MPIAMTLRALLIPEALIGFAVNQFILSGELAEELETLAREKEGADNIDDDPEDPPQSEGIISVDSHTTRALRWIGLVQDGMHRRSVGMSLIRATGWMRGRNIEMSKLKYKSLSESSF